MLARKPFLTSTVGSFPQPDELRKARIQVRNGNMRQGEYLALCRRHSFSWIEFQKELGMDVLVGGEFERDDMAAYFGEFFGGRRLDFVRSYENRFYRPIEYFEDIKHPGQSILKDNFLFLKSAAEGQPVKETITGPATMADWAIIRHDGYYRDRVKFRMNFADALRQEIESLIPAGLEILQLDEPALTTSMANFKMDLDAIRSTIGGLEDKLYLILHICYSGLDALNAAFPEILELPFHQIHMEMANRDYGLVKLIEKHGFAGKDIGLGVLDVHNDRVEAVDEIMDGIGKILKLVEPGTNQPVFAPEQIWLTPDCGMKNDRSAKEKLQRMTNVADICRGGLVVDK